MSVELVIGIVAGVAALGLLAYFLVKAYGRESKSGAVDKTKREQLEEAIRRENKADIIGAGPIPLSVAEQLRRLRALRERLHRRRSKAMSDDDVRSDG